MELDPVAAALLGIALIILLVLLFLVVKICTLIFSPEMLLSLGYFDYLKLHVSRKSFHVL